jgi:Domain of unknown function (DUF5122) beta-propeller
MVLQRDGKPVLAGTHGVVGGTSDILVLRYTRDGGRDASFGVDGAAVVALAGPSASSFGLALQPDGKIVAGGELIDAERHSAVSWSSGLQVTTRRRTSWRLP